MSRRKQTKPLRLNEDEELQTGKISVRLVVVMVDGGGDGSLSTVSCEGDCDGDCDWVFGSLHSRRY